MATKKDPVLQPLQKNSQVDNIKPLQLQSNKLAPITNAVENKKPQPNIPPSLLQQMAIKKDPVLRPLQNNSQVDNIKPTQLQLNKLAPITNVAKNKEPVRPKYKLIEDADVPLNIVDEKQGRSFQKIEEIGHGSFARVYKVLDHQVNKYFAAKVISKSSLETEQMKKKLLAEINIHRVLNHDYIVQFYTCFEDNNNVYLIMELCSNNTLGSMIRIRGSLSEDETRYYMGQILSALRYMSDNHVLHRDLKLGNVLIDSKMECKLGDFGLSTLFINQKNRKFEICGTPIYIAPEIVLKRGHGTKADMWSAGIILYNLLFGSQPFPKDFHTKLRDNDIDSRYYFPRDFDVSFEAKDLIKKLIIINPDERLSIFNAPEHYFFLEH